MGVSRVAGLVVVVLSLGACWQDVVMCDSDRICVDTTLLQGVCVDDGRGARYCAFPTLSCPSRLRWHDTAAEDLRKLCVDEMLLTRPVDFLAPPDMDASTR